MAHQSRYMPVNQVSKSNYKNVKQLYTANLYTLNKLLLP